MFQIFFIENSNRFLLHTNVKHRRTAEEAGSKVRDGAERYLTAAEKHLEK